MKKELFDMYLEGMFQINNEEILQNFTVNSFSSLKEDNRKTLHKKTYKRAFPNEFNNPKNVVKLGDLSKVLNG